MTRAAELTERARALRAQQTEPEQRLWFALRAKRFGGCTFRRQKVIGRYIADFASNQPKLVIEVDGDTHGDRVAYDDERTAFLESQGYCVIRFTNDDVMTNLEGVLAAIAGHLPLSQPSPLKGRGL